MWNSGRSDYSEFPNILPGDVKGEFFAKGTEKYRVLGGLMGEEVENLDDQGFPKIKDLAVEEMWVFSS